MNRLTLGVLKRSLNNKVGNYCNDDDRLTDLINRACERLLYELKSIGTFYRYRVCLNNACITWPRAIETIEAVAICRRPGLVRNGWFEFLENGPGVLKTDSLGMGLTLLDAGEGVSFDNVEGTNKKIAVSVDVTEATGATILIQYYDSNGQWVRTQDADGVWMDGEVITLPATGAYAFTSLDVMPDGLVRVIKPVTNGVVRLWEHNNATSAKKALAIYEPSEEIPVYRKSTIPNLPNIPCSERDDACDKISVEVVAKIRFIPVTNDNDFLPISHVDAIRLACQAIHKEESDMLADAATYWQMAIRCLTKQLEHWMGHGQVQPIRMVGSSTFGGHVLGLR